MPPRASWRNRLKQDVVEKAEFEKAILGLILVNTIVLALDRHPIEKAETDGLEVSFVMSISSMFDPGLLAQLESQLAALFSRYVPQIVGFILTLFFTIEMLLRVAATGTAAYLSDPACGFDAFVVFASLIELAIAPPAVLGGEEGGEGGALTALRCVRLFRISRLVSVLLITPAILFTYELSVIAIYFLLVYSSRDGNECK